MPDVSSLAEPATPTTTPTLYASPVTPDTPALLPFGNVVVHDLPPRPVPEATTWWSAVGAYMHTGSDTVRGVVEGDLLTRAPQRVAMDIETHGVDEGRFSITCVTAAFHDNAGEVHTVLLDPLRRSKDMSTLRLIVNHASSLVFHNATFDIPPLYAHGIFAYQDINKVEDTILLARMIHTNRRAGRTLEDLSIEYGVADDSKTKIASAMRAAGFRTQTDGFEQCDIDQDFYRRGAMSDTAVTLKLWDRLYAKVMDTIANDRPTTNNPRAFLSTPAAEGLVNELLKAMHVMLRASARGLAIDTDYMDWWEETSAAEVEGPSRIVESARLRYNVGADVIAYMDDQGILPKDWPRTDKGKLKADKAAMQQLEDYLSSQKLEAGVPAAHLAIAAREKDLNYFKAMRASAHATGRVHTSMSVLGAAASGRMSANSPALQQFSADARMAVVSDTGQFWSVDWSSIEPVVLSNAAGDTQFITPFNEGHDLYIPTAQKAGLIPPELTEYEAKHWKKDDRGEWTDHPGRKKSKTMLLAQMYGQGLPSLAAAHGWTEQEAQDIASGMRSAMEPTFRFMDQVRRGCKASDGFHNTLRGRVLEDTLQVTDDFGRSYTKVLDRVAVNHFCQGSAADVLYSTLARLEDMGAGDHIHMPIHDELITDDEGVEAVKEVMSTPPDWLVEGSRTDHVVLRIDAQPMGGRWRKV
jgi:DNA polymerase-1